MSTHAYPASYPVAVDALPDPAVSRWLWLVKWLLAIPHFVVLVFLWIAFVVLSVVALVAIVVTGRYPRAIFDFNVGVLRWSWRVSYYTYGALATDRYPPFTLDDVPDYPAHLEVAYPERLSRGLALVKWWLLAVPHYLVIGFFVGGGFYWVTRDAGPDGGTYEPVNPGGLIAVLVLVAAIVLAVTGSYPRGIYDLVLGLNRWVLRVAAYAGLMTDRYPPFRLDMGGPDPAHVVVAAPAGPSPITTTAGDEQRPVPGGSPAPGRWTAGRVVSLLVGTVLVLAGLGAAGAGTAALVADRALRSDGYLTSATTDVTTAGYAVVADDIVMEGGEEFSWVDVYDVVGNVRIRVTPEDPQARLFLGIADVSDAAAFLDGVPVARVRDAGVAEVAGGRTPPSAPRDAGIWVASVEGPGAQQLGWRPEGGRWAVVVMNADGSPGLAVEGEVGATVPWLDAAALVVLVGGAVAFLAGAAFVAAAVVSASRSRRT